MLQITPLSMSIAPFDDYKYTDNKNIVTAIKSIKDKTLTLQEKM